MNPTAQTDCNCELNHPEPDGEQSWHYTRTCPHGHTWGALHCAHDSVQNPCPDCGWIEPGKQTPTETLVNAMTEPPRNPGNGSKLNDLARGAG